MFEIQGTPIIRVDIWSHRLGAWVFLVSQKTGQNPPGTYEITPAEVHRMQELVDDGWPIEQAIYRTLGVRS